MALTRKHRTISERPDRLAHLTPSTEQTWNLGAGAKITLKDGKARVSFRYSGIAVTKKELDQVIEILMFVQQEMRNT